MLFRTPLLRPSADACARYNDAKLANEWLPHPYEHKDLERDAFTLGFCLIPIELSPEHTTDDARRCYRIDADDVASSSGERDAREKCTLYSMHHTRTPAGPVTVVG